MLYPIAIEMGSATEAHSVVFPDVKGCFSAGDTLEEAIKNAKEALEFHLESYAKDGILSPSASSLKKHINNPEFAGWTGSITQCLSCWMQCLSLPSSV